MTQATDARFMAMALALGRRGMGRVWPNPAVGCVIVRDGVVLGRGRTADGGRPHAEVIALAQAGDAHGATAYVTLEPCAHHGQTPPCADALVAAGVARVVVATTDPDPRVAGKGIRMLRNAGIVVDVGCLGAQADRDHAGFFKRLQAKRPYLTLKLACSLDGRIATASGESQWITGPAARREVHMMRARHDAVMVGAGTVRADDPELTVRGLGIDRQPLRIVVSRNLAIPVDGKLGRTARDVPVWLCHGPRADTALWEAAGATSVPCHVAHGQVDPVHMLAQLADRGLTRIFCEGGGGLAASLLGAGLVDELVVFQAGMVIGAEGTPALAAMGLGKLADAPRFTLVDQRQTGPDTLQRWAAV
ncbi:bifunctional diaminohydroxyphosphoribosylaminopyrimidine deaminase/5-amino-6-(5-phosphoribosylamino)uracil reductase RibD [Yoonia sp. 208BN28-4]|uniref:bifunctional diaminohydroxyphosphoribosylaminopyrimidine deaminase/5-amino-6-(5-phosphoribosylamino)uracil reductase RibD n=1 Tax=Yoonia sp. 208BN28-4 TaxID=3126505 RepID=UPI0030A31158